MTRRANAVQSQHCAVQLQLQLRAVTLQLATARRCVEMRRLRELEEGSDAGDSDDSEYRDQSCTICGRRGGDGNFYQMEPDDCVMCDVCQDTGPTGAVISSFF